MKKLSQLLMLIILPLTLRGEITRFGTLSSETWSEDVHITADATIGSGVTITILPGVTVRFDPGADLLVISSGRLLADASSGSQITFTAYDGVSWGHIHFTNTTATLNSLIYNCVIEKGDVRAYPRDVRWGGALLLASNKVDIKNCIFRNNKAYNGGAVYIADASPQISESLFSNNLATNVGGGVCVRFGSSTIVKNCIFYANSSLTSTGGGGAYIGYNSGGSKFLDCTFVNNTAPSATSGFDITLDRNTTSIVVINSILWGNNNAVKYVGQTPAATDFQNCAIQGTIITGSSTNSISLSSSNTALTGPNFVATDGSDWSLRFISPCRDAGTTPSPVVPTDFIGNSRISNYDIGAYEYQYSRWTGATSNSWSTPSNWELNLDPSSGPGDILIPSGLSVYPDVTTTDDYTIGSGKYLIIDQGAKLTLDDLTNNGILKLYHAQNTTGFASLILTSYTRGTGGTEEIQLYLEGGGSAGPPATYKWHYISSPASSIAITPFTAVSLDLAQFVESRPASSLMQGWVAFDGYVYSTGLTNGPTFNAMPAGQGFMYWDNNNNLFTFSGVLNTTDQVVSLGYSGIPSLHGYNLLGNPFSSGLDWDQISLDPGFPGSVSKAIYFTRNNQECSYVNGVGNPSGTTGLIPPMQGFFTKTSASGNSIVLAASARIHDGIHARYKGESIIPLARLTIRSTNNSSDETVIRFDEAAKTEFDNNFDATKLFIDPALTKIYSISGTTKFSINGLPIPTEANPSTVIPISVNLIADTIHTIISPIIQGLPANVNVYFKDISSGFTQDLTQTALDYKFSAPAGLINNRFSILAIITGTENIPESKGDFSIYPANGFVNIMTLGEKWNGKIGNVRVIDITGKVYSETRNLEFAQSSLIQVPGPSVKGVYLIELSSGNVKHISKIIIR